MEVVSNKLVVILQESGLDKSRAQNILENFRDAFETVAQWERAADKIIVNDENDTEAMELAGTGAKILLKIRTGIEAKRVEMKAPALNEARIIDGLAKTLTGLVAPVEENLKNKWKWVENRKKAEFDARQKEVMRRMREEEIERVRLEEEEKDRLQAENDQLRKDAEAREKAVAEENRKKNVAILAERQKTADAERKAQEQQEKAEAEKKLLEERLASIERQDKEVTCPYCLKRFIPSKGE